MRPPRPLVIGLLAAGLAIVTGLIVLPRLGRPSTLSGYVEGEALYMAAPVAGSVKVLQVVRGQTVEAGAPLFVVDPEQPRAARDQAAAEVAAAQAAALDVRKGQRPVELAVLEANIAAAQARAVEAQAQYRRVSTLAAKGFQSRAALDDAKATLDAANAQTAAARRQRDAAALGARDDQVRAADARVGQAQAGLAGADARLRDIAPVAPSKGRVEETYFQPGEWAAANQPILSLLPDDRIKLRFFVPEPKLSAYRVGDRVNFTCDGCAKGLTARIDYISPRPEFTPPVIYSRETRDRLVYLVEARPSVRLNPGQPVDVEPLGSRR